MKSIVKIGLTGGIAAGKSEVARILRENGVQIVDMDQLSKDLLSNDKELQKEVIEQMGTEILTAGSIDRAKLRAMVFSSPDKKKLLEHLIHPKVRKTFENLSEQAFHKGTKLIICEAALLIEGGYRKTLDRLVVVWAPETLRLQRLIQRDHISPELAKQMIGTQVSDEERLAAATYVIKNEQDLNSLKTQVLELISAWKKEHLLP